jgi:protein ImuA
MAVWLRRRGPGSSTVHPRMASARPSVAPHRHPGRPGGGRWAASAPAPAGLLHEGLDEGQLVWVQAELPAERLWVGEQLIKSHAAAPIVAWLPQARQEQQRRLEVCAHACESPVFLYRPEAVRHGASAAPLRVLASVGLDWELSVSVFKRRGPVHDGVLVLPSVPGGLTSVLTPRLRKPSRPISREVTADVVGSTGVTVRPRQYAALQ